MYSCLNAACRTVDCRHAVGRKAAVSAFGNKYWKVLRQEGRHAGARLNPRHNLARDSQREKSSQRIARPGTGCDDEMSGAVNAPGGANLNVIALRRPRQDALFEVKFGSGPRCGLKLSADTVLWNQVTGAGLIDRRIARQRREGRKPLSDFARLQQFAGNAVLLRRRDCPLHKLAFARADDQAARDVEQIGSRVAPQLLPQFVGS